MSLSAGTDVREMNLEIQGCRSKKHGLGSVVSETAIRDGEANIELYTR
jgi:hypothetical protein